MFAILAFPFSAMAGSNDFFEALYDVPVMEGLEEMKGEAVLFDKPDGKIASVTAASKTLTSEQIQGFYGQTLPQMGWKKIKENQYIRGKEGLVMNITDKKPLTIVQFTLSPAR